MNSTAIKNRANGRREGVAAHPASDPACVVGAAARPCHGMSSISFDWYQNHISTSDVEAPESLRLSGGLRQRVDS